MTVSERKANVIAQLLVRAIRAIENFNDDPEMILSDAEIVSNRDCEGVKEAIQVLKKHYNGELTQ